VTGLSTLVVIDREASRWSTQAKGVRPQVKLLDENGEEVKIAGTEHSVAITFQVGSLITVKDGQQIGVGDVLARIPQESAKTRDITGGLPRVAELFEARAPKDAGMLAEYTGTVSFGKETKGKQRLVITEPDGTSHEFLIPKDKHLMVHDGQVVNKGELIVDGPSDPHDILRLQGISELARYIIDEVQDVYRLQGVKINDKHIEVIVRQMLRRVVITDPGDTGSSARSRSSAPRCWTRTTASRPKASCRRSTRTCCWASPRPRCRPTPSSPRPPSRRPPAC
jgi:DNA-directed RNA polymerase subunit beta'